MEWVRETVPPALRPVVESILAEMGGVGLYRLGLADGLDGDQPSECWRNGVSSCLGKETYWWKKTKMPHQSL